jgi:hypothetical protein
LDLNHACRSEFATLPAITEARKRSLARLAPLIYAPAMHRTRLAKAGHWGLVLVALLFSRTSVAQSPPATPAPAPTNSTPSAAFEPAPGSATAPPVTAAPAPVTPAPAPAYPAPAYPAPAPAPAYPAQPRYAASADPAPGYASPPGAYTPPPEKPDSGFQRPEISIRVDPFNWLLEGRLGFELETEIWKIITLELVPVFVVNQSPPTFNLGSRSAELTQHSNGLGALAGTSVGAGFWLEGKPYRGYVLRAIFTDYGFTYRSADDLGQIDEVSHTERHFYGFLGSHNRWGAFTLAGGLGLGVELNKQKRCFSANATSVSAATTSCRNDELQIALDRSVTDVANLNSWSYPVELLFRFSLGVVF